jgi:zinc and cadmium transporter
MIGSELLTLIFWLLVGGIFSLAGGVVLLVLKNRVEKYVLEMTSFAAGVMVVVATMDLLPEAYSSGDIKIVSAFVLAGTLFLFFLERFSLWFHHHHSPHNGGINVTSVWLGDTFHNAIDGLAIGAAFLVEPKLGIATAIAVAAHELPQEIADFSLYISSGVSSTRTFILNLFSSLATLIAGVSIYFLGNNLQGVETYLLALTAGMFMYISLADLIPELHHTTAKKEIFRQTLAFIFGIAVALINIRIFEG